VSPEHVSKTARGQRKDLAAGRGDRMRGCSIACSNDYGAALVAFDVVFAESDRNSGLQGLGRPRPEGARAVEAIASRCTRSPRRLQYDGSCAEDRRPGGRLLGYYCHRAKTEPAVRATNLPDPVLVNSAVRCKE